jgi:hypothetical protein
LYIFSFPVEFPICQSWKIHKMNNAVSCVLWHQLCVLCPLVVMLFTLLERCIVATTSERLSLLRDTQGVSGTCEVGCQSHSLCGRLISARVLNLISSLLTHQVPGSWARCKLRSLVFVNQHTNMKQVITTTAVDVSLFPADTTIPISSCIEHPPYIINSLDITWRSQNHSSNTSTPLRPYTTCYIPSELPSEACNCIIMLMPQM